MQSPRLLVTTSKSFLLMDPRSGHSHRIDEGRGLYYGIASDNRRIWVGARNRLVSSELPPAEERGQILIFDRHWRCDALPAAPFPLRDIHQILLRQNRLWVTCAFDNCIAIYDGDSHQWMEWHPLGVPQDEPKDMNHFNSLEIFDQHLCVVAHNKGDSDLLFFQLPDYTLVNTVRLGKQAHNVWRRGSAWATCSSGEGKLVSTDGWTVETGGFPRGVVFLGEEICVGVSEIAERNQRDFTTGQLLFFDQQWRLDRSINLMDEGLVLDIYPLPIGWNPPARDLIEFPVVSRQ